MSILEQESLSSKLRRTRKMVKESKKTDKIVMDIILEAIKLGIDLNRAQLFFIRDIRKKQGKSNKEIEFYLALPQEIKKLAMSIDEIPISLPSVEELLYRRHQINVEKNQMGIYNGLQSGPYRVLKR
jgi:hypothetical protein